MLILSTLLCLAGVTRAQDMGNQNRDGDSTRHHRNYQSWKQHGRSDSLSHRNGFAYDHGRGRYPRRGMKRYHHSGHTHQHSWYAYAPVHYTPGQRKQVQAINESYRKKSADLYKNDNLTLREYKSQLLALQKDRKAKMNALLTADQKTAIANWKKRADEHAQISAAARLERMKIRLNLTDLQTASIKSQQQMLRSQMLAIRENDNLLPEQKREQMRDLVSKQKDALKSVLTPDQLSQLESMHKQRFSRS